MRKGFLLLLFFVFFSPSFFLLQAQFRSSTLPKNTHFLALHGGVGYSTMIENISELTTLGSPAGSLGLSYCFQLPHFWIEAGIEAQYLAASSHCAISGFDKWIADTQGKLALAHYDFDRFNDRQQFIFLSVPILVGYSIQGFYIGAGAKFGKCVFSQESAKLSYTTSATYDRYIEDFSQMSTHFYSTYSASAKKKLGTQYLASVIFETGYDVLTQARIKSLTYHHGLRIGIYAEYGLNNLISSSKDGELYQINPNNAFDITIQPFYLARAGRVNSLFAGLKITWIFCLRTKHCDCEVSHNREDYYF